MCQGNYRHLMARWVLIYVCGVGSPRGGEVFAEVVYKAFQFVDAGFKSPFVGGESIMVDLQPIVDVWIDGLRSKLGS